MTDFSASEDLSSQPVVLERQSAVCNGSLSHVQLACTHRYCAFPLKNDLSVWHTANRHEQPMILKGHHQPITAVAIQEYGDQWLACSASPDYIITWNLSGCRQDVLQGLLPRGRVIGTLLGDVQHIAFHCSKKLVAACAGLRVFILNVQKEEILAELLVHQAPVTGAEFWHDSFLLCISEDRTFSVWDYHREQLIYQSGIISAYPLLKMYIDVENDQLLTGCADGMIRVFSLVKEHNFRCLCNINLQKEKQKFCRRLKKFDQPEKTEKVKAHIDGKLPENGVDSGLPVLHIRKCKQPQHCHMSLFGNPSLFWIGSSTDLVFLNIATSEVEAVLHYEDFSSLSVHLAGSVALSCEGDFCLMSSMFENQISLFEFDTHSVWKCQQEELNSCGSEMKLTIISSDPLLSTSPLCSHLTRKSGATKMNVSQKKTQDKPLVFNNKIKSSGYTAAPRMNLFSPKTNIKKNQCSKVKKEVSSGITKEYPMDSSAPKSLQKQITLSTRSTSVCDIQYSGDGMKLACGLSDKTLLMFSSTLNGEPTVFTGHDGPISGLGWSYDKSMLVSTSEDGTLRLWNVKASDSILTLGKDMFSRPVCCPQFYYMDKFILSSSGADIHLMKYYLDDSKDDLKRYKQKNVCKLIERFSLDSVEITALSAVNDFYSYIVLAAGTNRAVEIFDMNVGRRAATIPDVHTRAAHQICQNKGSAFSTQSSDAYNLFVTTAIGDSPKLWDIRTLRCVRRFEGHVNRYQPCGVAISPCGRFIACGSEDRCAYIYEKKSSTYLQKLKEHTESVINVAFNPSAAQLTTCTVDGKLQTFVP